MAIAIRKANQGKLRKTAGARSGRKVPISELRRLKRSHNPITRKRATFALNARTKFRNAPAKSSGGKRKRSRRKR